ncbi:potassium channel family protein [Oryzihumus sp.]|uniref:potassium channel family protein n=1 Tax=Oryzihumus sp. TaxID=1968903 RepID=UPI002EDAFCE2
MSRPGRLDDGGPRRLVAALLRSLSVATVVLVLYFTVPLDGTRVHLTVWVVLLLLVVAGLLVWQVRSILRSPHPRLRAVEAVGTTLPLFLVICASTHFLIELADAGNYSQPMTRLDALYFVVTVFATVGFGDITPVSQTARIVTTLQMVGDLAFVGIIARVLVGAVQEGLRRQGRGPGPGA